uniref:Uncharacterized protein n=1 Tax=Chromera velia CCMP2878 TaxID=1169474 RepID=A0A0G4GDH6_9ALVE
MENGGEQSRPSVPGESPRLGAMNLGVVFAWDFTNWEQAVSSGEICAEVLALTDKDLYERYENVGIPAIDKENLTACVRMSKLMPKVNGLLFSMLPQGRDLSPASSSLHSPGGHVGVGGGGGGGGDLTGAPGEPQQGHGNSSSTAAVLPVQGGVPPHASTGDVFFSPFEILAMELVRERNTFHNVARVCGIAPHAKTQAVLVLEEKEREGTSEHGASPGGGGASSSSASSSSSIALSGEIEGGGGEGPMKLTPSALAKLCKLPLGLRFEEGGFRIRIDNIGANRESRYYPTQIQGSRFSEPSTEIWETIAGAICGALEKHLENTLHLGILKCKAHFQHQNPPSPLSNRSLASTQQKRGRSAHAFRWHRLDTVSAPPLSLSDSEGNRGARRLSESGGTSGGGKVKAPEGGREGGGVDIISPSQGARVFSGLRKSVRPAGPVAGGLGEGLLPSFADSAAAASGSSLRHKLTLPIPGKASRGIGITYEEEDEEEEDADVEEGREWTRVRSPATAVAVAAGGRGGTSVHSGRKQSLLLLQSPTLSKTAGGHRALLSPLRMLSPSKRILNLSQSPSASARSATSVAVQSQRRKERAFAALVDGHHDTAMSPTSPFTRLQSPKVHGLTVAPEEMGRGSKRSLSPQAAGISGASPGGAQRGRMAALRFRSSVDHPRGEDGGLREDPNGSLLPPLACTALSPSAALSPSPLALAGVGGAVPRLHPRMPPVPLDIPPPFAHRDARPRINASYSAEAAVGPDKGPVDPQLLAVLRGILDNAIQGIYLDPENGSWVASPVEDGLISNLTAPGPACYSLQKLPEIAKLATLHPAVRRPRRYAALMQADAPPSTRRLAESTAARAKRAGNPKLPFPLGGLPQRRGDEEKEKEGGKGKEGPGKEKEKEKQLKPFGRVQRYSIKEHGLLEAYFKAAHHILRLASADRMAELHEEIDTLLEPFPFCASVGCAVGVDRQFLRSLLVSEAPSFVWGGATGAREDGGGGSGAALVPGSELASGEGDRDVSLGETGRGGKPSKRVWLQRRVRSTGVLEQEICEAIKRLPKVSQRVSE